MGIEAPGAMTTAHPRVPARRSPRRRLADSIGLRLLRTFAGTAPTPAILDAIAGGRTSGVTIFRHANVASPAQLRGLTERLQAARPAGSPPLLVGADQEGGQLQAIAGATAWPGNLALGAARSTRLAWRAGEAIGRELAAVGVNLAYAPDCDLLLSRHNPAIGTRAFGDDPAAVGPLASALARGLQSAGVAATLKHFPGHGSADEDSHLGLPVVTDDLETLLRRDLEAYRPSIRAGARAVMVAHLAVPAVTGGRTVPATLASELISGVLRDRLGFRGVIVSDALNMRSFGAADELAANAVRAAAAGIDLLLLAHDAATEEHVYDALLAAARDGRLPIPAVAPAARRVMALRRWTARAEPRPPLEIVDGAAHRALAREIAERSVTVVRDLGRLLPLRIGTDDRVAVIAPLPTDLSPADTSSTIRLDLAGALRRHMPVDAWTMPLDPAEADVVAVRVAASSHTAAIVGTIDAVAHPGQASLVRALLAAGVPTVAVALRTPFDLEAYPEAGTYLCTYGIQPPSIDALVEGLTGGIELSGRLPVALRMPTVVPLL